MVYSKKWSTFSQDAHDMVVRTPGRTRFTTKWSAGKGLLVLKVTNDRECIKFKSRSAIILNRFEALTRGLQREMHGRGSAATPAVSSVPGGPVASENASRAVQRDPEGAAAIGGAVILESGKQPPSKKKKGKKRK